MFQVKICGVTSPKDACLAAAAGADCIGLNFVPGSPRCISAETAHTIRTSVPSGVTVVGVFAGASSDVIRHIVSSVGLDAVQLHGHLAKESSDLSSVDTPERCNELKPLPVIRAVRLQPSSPSGDGLALARQWLHATMQLGHPPVMAIVDAPVSRETTAGQMGGTGAVVDWTVVAKTKPLGVPMALAGGLTAENVAMAIQTSGLRAVDTASGVESSPGQKDEEKLFRFVHAARLALQNA
ncbi:MAG: phosphoribosylanthranilate isomerase [Pirellulales bacterium]